MCGLNAAPTEHINRERTAVRNKNKQVEGELRLVDTLNLDRLGDGLLDGKLASNVGVVEALRRLPVELADETRSETVGHVAIDTKAFELVRKMLKRILFGVVNSILS